VSHYEKDVKSDGTKECEFLEYKRVQGRTGVSDSWEDGVNNGLAKRRVAEITG
jgi:hypothetical protein